MKKLVFTLLLLSIVCGLRAQYVTIPDANFKRELMQLFPNCFNASQQMDTTCVGVTRTTRLDISFARVINFEGLQYFDILDSLSISINGTTPITNFPRLPSTLRYFFIGNAYVTNFPPLPPLLEEFRCVGNNATSLPSLPSSLRIFSVYFNPITSIPQLPQNLEQIIIGSTQITSLPTLPSSLKTLNCSENSLTSIPVLPQTIEEFDCSNNPLVSFPQIPFSIKKLSYNFVRIPAFPALPNTLQVLKCAGNQILMIPRLPDSLTILDCSSNFLSTLPTLNGKLEELNCSDNSITTLPALGPNLTKLDCSSNRITALPQLPYSIVELKCSNNFLTSVETANTSLVDLYADNNLITRVTFSDTLRTAKLKNNRLVGLPDLNFWMHDLDCSYNQLRSLPALEPSILFYLYCSHNQLTELPVLPGGLMTFDCSHNNITRLPELTYQLYQLDCSFNQLTTLPALPDLIYHLSCNNNPGLSCLPLFPDWAFQVSPILNVSATQISCIPNTTSNVGPFTFGLPVCTNSSQICPTNPMVSGVVFNDYNNNGLREPNEGQVGNIPIVTTPNNWTALTDTFSYFKVKLDSLPVVNVIAPGRSIPYRSFSPSSYTVTTTNAGLLPSLYDFAMQAQPNITDLVTHFSTWFHRPGFQTSASVNVENIGTIDQANASISLEIPNGLSVISVTPANGIVTGNTVTWSGESIAIFERKNYWVSLQVPATMSLGSSLTYSAQATPANTDFTPADNAVTETVIVRGSYDPNDKLVNKNRLPNNYVAADEEMLYTIRFQNTGTDTAFTVLIRDTLDLQKLDFSTFRVTGASHALRTNVRERGVVEFVFNNINLPDSFVNEPLSHGYVQFRIHPKANLPLSTQIRNRAFIYFDFNAPIITNYATTTVGLLSLNEAQLGSGSLSLYPVPVAEVLNVNFNAVRAGEVRYRLLDLQGRILQEQQVQIVEGENITTMDTSKLGSGMYVLQVLGEDGSVTTKLVKE